jgi:asparagine synthase (glutamine-hydrolysing)
MCGISGELRTDGAPADATSLSLMNAALRHRGPDDQDAYCAGSIGLAHRRLSILDLSPLGRQPMWTDDRTMAIVYNGEVYNFREIAAELRTKGYTFRSTGDTEVVLKAVHCWGAAAALRRFIGMFAFAIWDDRRRVLLLCRDRAGIKPLYFYTGAKRVLFGSEMKALLAHPAFPRELSRDALADFFTFGYAAGDRTAFQSTRTVPAGHYAEISAAGDVSIHRYWSIDDVERGSFRGTFEDACEQLQELCEHAFAYRLISDVPVAVFLSGGIDSSLVAALLSKRLGADLLHLTIGFRQAAFDEAPKAVEVARQLGIRHEVTYLESPDAAAALQSFVDTYDEPFADTSGIPTALVSAVARRHVKVALSADGGDEQFCGYDSYRAYSTQFERLRAVPLVLRRFAASAVRRAVPYEAVLSATAARLASDTVRPQAIARFEKLLALLDAADTADVLGVMNRKAFSVDESRDLLNPSGSPVHPATALDASGAQRRDGLIDAMLRTDYTLFMRDDVLAKVDRASMAVSLECRDPLLDHRIAEFAFALPLDYLCGRGQQKRILKQLLRSYLSADIVNAPKRGFSIPLYQWMKGPWQPFVREYLSPSHVRAVGVLDDRIVSREVERFYRHEGGRAEKLFTMLNFQMWAHRWWKAAPAVAA